MIITNYIIGSIGISIANNLKELEKAYQYAYEMSVEKRVIIEEYIYKADKVDFYYLAENGQLTLLTSCDTINELLMQHKK